MNEELPLLSNSFRKDLEAIRDRYDCIISRALLRADKKEESVTDYATMLTVRYDDEELDGENFTISFLPKGKKPIYVDDGKWGLKNRQTGKIGKVIQSLLETKDEITKEFVRYKGKLYRRNNIEYIKITE